MLSSLRLPVSLTRMIAAASFGAGRLPGQANSELRFAVTAGVGPSCRAAA